MSFWGVVPRFLIDVCSSILFTSVGQRRSIFFILNQVEFVGILIAHTLYA